LLTSPNYTQIPNEIFDDYMDKLTGAELKVLLKICRNTFGWQKEIDKISISQIEKSTGLGKTIIISAVKKLEKLDLIEAYREDKKSTSYMIKVDVVQKVNKGCSESEQEGHKSCSESEHTKEILKETIKRKGKNIPPSIQEIQEYLQEKNIKSFTADTFFNFYESKGWHVGKNKMTDWRAAVRTWASKDKPAESKMDKLNRIGRLMEANRRLEGQRE